MAINVFSQICRYNIGKTSMLMCDSNCTDIYRQYDKIRKQSLTWTQKLSDQLNLAHVDRKNTKKKKLKQTHGSAQLV